MKDKVNLILFAFLVLMLGVASIFRLLFNDATYFFMRYSIGSSIMFLGRPLLVIVFCYLLYRLTVDKNWGMAWLTWFISNVFLSFLIALSAYVNIHVVGGYNESLAFLIVTWEAMFFIVPVSLGVVILRNIIKRLLQNRF